MNGARRNHRVASLIRAELAALLLGEVSDPGLEGVSVTEVKVSTDLREAIVYCQVTGGQWGPVEKALSRAGGFLRRQVAERVGLRVAPELSFRLDTHTDEVARLMKLLETVGEGTVSGVAG